MTKLVEVYCATLGLYLALWWDAIVMTGAGAAILDHEVEAMSASGKVKQERDPGFLHQGATFSILGGLYSDCYRREKYTFCIGLCYSSHTYNTSHALYHT